MAVDPVRKEGTIENRAPNWYGLAQRVWHSYRLSIAEHKSRLIHDELFPRLVESTTIHLNHLAYASLYTEQAKQQTHHACQ